jgi:hypothetical protein
VAINQSKYLARASQCALNAYSCGRTDITRRHWAVRETRAGGPAQSGTGAGSGLGGGIPHRRSRAERGLCAHQGREGVCTSLGPRGFGIAVLEALACGVPVVTTSAPDNLARHLVARSVHGTICDSSAPAIAAAIKVLLAAGSGSSGRGALPARRSSGMGPVAAPCSDPSMITGVLPTGQTVLRVEFAAPSPFGLLGP